MSPRYRNWEHELDDQEEDHGSTKRDREYRRRHARSTSDAAHDDARTGGYAERNGFWPREPPNDRDALAE